MQSYLIKGFSRDIDVGITAWIRTDRRKETILNWSDSVEVPRQPLSDRERLRYRRSAGRRPRVQQKQLQPEPPFLTI